MAAITWRKTGVYVLVILPLLGLAGIAALARPQEAPQQNAPDPVAEAARKARAQKKTEPKPKKVFTNDDVAGAAPEPTVAAPATGSAGEEKKENDGAEAKGDKGAGADKAGAGDPNSEEAWRKRFREARSQLAQGEKELDILQREGQKAQTQYYADPQKALSEQYSRKDITDRDTKIEAKKQEVAQMKQHIADLEDELRKSGGNSGWAR